MAERSPLDVLDGEAPPDVGLLADAVEMLEARFPDDPAVEELVHLALGRVLVAVEVRKRRALRRLAELLAAGEYASVRQAAPKVAREVGVAPATVRWWWAEAPGVPPRAP